MFHVLSDCKSNLSTICHGFAVTLCRNLNSLSTELHNSRDLIKLTFVAFTPEKTEKSPKHLWDLDYKNGTIWPEWQILSCFCTQAKPHDLVTSCGLVGSVQRPLHVMSWHIFKPSFFPLQWLYKDLAKYENMIICETFKYPQLHVLSRFLHSFFKLFCLPVTLTLHILMLNHIPVACINRIKHPIHHFLRILYIRHISYASFATCCLCSLPNR